MADATLLVRRAGPLVTVQDGGRPGLMRFGVPASGPMDRGSFAIANLALGNPEATPAIEVSMGGLALDCVAGAVTFAVAGGGFRMAVDETAHGAWTIATIAAGSRLEIAPGHWGSWTYLAFAGRLRSRLWLGSASTYAPAALGGGVLAAGQELVIEAAERREALHGAIPCPVGARPRQSVRVVLGPQDRCFPRSRIEALLSETFALSTAYDRMGVRLAGPSLAPAGALDLPSEAISRGAIQVSGDGVATVLLADHQTTGGYPRIATILSEDLDGFVQLRSRGLVAFRAITPKAAVESARTRQLTWRRFLARLSARAASRHPE